MRNTIKFFVLIALAAIIGFSFALSLTGCDTGSGGGGGGGGGPQKATYVSTDSNGNKYTLEIDESGKRSARSAARQGDTFKLTVEYSTTVGGGGLKMTFEYSGTVSQAQTSGATVSLTLEVNGERITITIVGTEMKVITGKIVDKSGQEIIKDPGDVTPVNPSNQGTAPAITTTSLPDGTVETAYSQTLTATGTTPITWTRESGTLPAGLTLSTTGTISGTPTTAATSTFTVKATNSTGSDTKQLSITIAAAAGAYALGSVGPAGGLIFYDRGNNDGAWRYLEAAPASAEFNSVWAAGPDVNVTGTSIQIGMGKQNTQVIIAAYGETENAAKKCADMNVGGYSDWFLPSRDEMYWMYNNLHKNGRGGFMNANYWTSNQNGGYAYLAYDRKFANGDWDYASKTAIRYVRAARMF